MGKTREAFKFKPRQRQALAAGSLRFLPEAQREALVDKIELVIEEWRQELLLRDSPKAARARSARILHAAKMAADLARFLRSDDGRVFLTPGFRVVDIERARRVVERTIRLIEAFAADLPDFAMEVRRKRGGQDTPEADLAYTLACFWRKYTGQRASSATNSRFMRLIDQLADDLRVVLISRSTVRRALADFDE